MTESRCFFLIFLLLAAAGFVIFRLDIPIRERLSQSAEKKGKMKSFKKQGRVSALLRKLLAKQQSLVASSAMPKSAYLVLSAACVVGGFFAGRIIYRSLFISSAVAVASAFIPLLVFSFRQTKSANARLERLCSSMMILSNSYLVTDDFITSVETNVDILEYPQPFRDFLAYLCRCGRRWQSWTGWTRRSAFLPKTAFIRWRSWRHTAPVSATRWRNSPGSGRRFV